MNIFKGLMQSIMHHDVPKKSAEASTAKRKEVNQLYASGSSDNQVSLEILSLYTQSAALAENDSEELALAYSNRSALLMRLGKYEECLSDVDMASRITKSDELKVKLMNRKSKCLMLIDESKVTKPTSPIECQDYVKQLEAHVVGQPSKHNPCAYKCVSLRCNDKFGRHMVATEDIKAGQIIALEKPFILFPNVDKIYLKCSHCLMYMGNGIPCKSCTVAVYCSEKCREEALSQYHDIECLVLPLAMYVAHTIPCLQNLLVAIRLFIKSIKSEGFKSMLTDVDVIDDMRNKETSLKNFFDNGIFQSDKFKSFYNLSFEKDDGFLIHTDFIGEIIDILANKTNIFSVEKDEDHAAVNKSRLVQSAKNLLFKLLLIVNRNGFGLQNLNCKCEDMEKCRNSCGESVETIVTLFYSLVNHTCCHNAEHLVIYNNQMIIYAIQPIKKGQQISISYGPSLHMRKEKRQEILKRSYNFECDCQACKENWPLTIDETIASDYKTGLMILLKFEEAGIPQTAFPAFFGPMQKWSMNKKTLQDLNRMIQITFKYLSNCKAYMHSTISRIYIQQYFRTIFHDKKYSENWILE